MNAENTSVQMRKGILEYGILLVIARGEVYTSDLIEELKAAKRTTKGKYLIRLSVLRSADDPVTVTTVNKIVPRAIKKAEISASFPQLI